MTSRERRTLKESRRDNRDRQSRMTPVIEEDPRQRDTGIPDTATVTPKEDGVKIKKTVRIADDPEQMLPKTKLVKAKSRQPSVKKNEY